MRLALIADGRAEHVRRWVRYFVDIGDELLLLSTQPCVPIQGVRVGVLPGLFRTRGLLVKHPGTRLKAGRAALAATSFGLRRESQFVWQQVRTLDMLWQAPAAQKLLTAFRPHLVHAFRLQTEGYVAALAGWSPWVVSTWGQDFVWFAHAYPLHRYLTRWAVKRADALLSDCRRDLRLARDAGFPSDRPVLICPGNGGVDFRVYRSGSDAASRAPLVVYPRGVAPYVRLDTLVGALSLLKASGASDDFEVIILVQSALVPVASAMVAAAALPVGRVRILPMLDQETLAALLQRAAVIVSPAVSDGTPNSMLEAMACGAFPVMGDIASIREWIRGGVNGLLFDPNSPEQLAACLREALANVALRQTAQVINLDLVKERADYSRVMPAVRTFYADVIDRARVDTVPQKAQDRPAIS